MPRIYANDLKFDELNYELTVRGISIPSSVEEKRKALTGALLQEKDARSCTLFSNPFQFSVDAQQVSASLAEVAQRVRDFSGGDGSAEHRRIVSKLIHLTGRIARINPIDNEEVDVRNKLRQQLYFIEADFDSKLNPDEFPPEPETVRAPPLSPLPATVNLPAESSGRTVPAIRGDSSITEFKVDATVRNEPEPAVQRPTVQNEQNPIDNLPLQNLQVSPFQNRNDFNAPQASTPHFPVNMFNKKVPVYKWGIRKFSGQGSLIAFLELVESLRISRGCTSEDLFASAGDLFEGHAWTWFHNAQRNHRFSSWDDLVTGLKQAFLKENYDRNLLDEIRAKKQGFREPVAVFISSMEAMFYRLTKLPSVAEMIDIIKINLLPDYVKLLALQNIQTVDELTCLCKRIEESLHLCNKATGHASTSHSFTRSPRVNAISSGLICFNCKKAGHHYRNCFSPRTLFCLRCGNPGVSTNSCTRCTKNVRPAGTLTKDAGTGQQPRASVSRVFTNKKTGK